MKNFKGFTLVELVIVIAIVIILSVISVPIYRGYVDKSKMAEGYALLGAILSAQKAYYSEYGNFLRDNNSANPGWRGYDDVLGIDARGNKYFTVFRIFDSSESTFNTKIAFRAWTTLPEELADTDERGRKYTLLKLSYNITTGTIYWKALN